MLKINIARDRAHSSHTNAEATLESVFIIKNGSIFGAVSINHHQYLVRRTSSIEGCNECVERVHIKGNSKVKESRSTFSCDCHDSFSRDSATAGVCALAPNHVNQTEAAFLEAGTLSFG